MNIGLKYHRLRSVGTMPYSTFFVNEAYLIGQSGLARCDGPRITKTSRSSPWVLSLLFYTDSDIGRYLPRRFEYPESWSVLSCLLRCVDTRYACKIYSKGWQAMKGRSQELGMARVFRSGFQPPHNVQKLQQTAGDE